MRADPVEWGSAQAAWIRGEEIKAVTINSLFRKCSGKERHRELERQLGLRIGLLRSEDPSASFHAKEKDLELGEYE